MTSAPPQQNREREKRPPPRKLAVIRKAYVTPNMLRVTLGGSELASFPEDREGGYVKLQPGAPGDGDKPLVRTYTIRSFHPATADSEAELNIDFVTHESEGPAAKWAMDCAPGDTIKVGGPGPRKSLDHTADWFLLVGDMSALPAISVNLERLPADAIGHALLEVISPDDRQPLNVPPGFRVEWFVNAAPETPSQVLLNAVKALPSPIGQPSVWVAGEFSQSLAIRTYLKTHFDIARTHMYASSYWQIGQTEDGHRISKQGAQS